MGWFSKFFKHNPNLLGVNVSSYWQWRDLDIKNFIYELETYNVQRKLIANGNENHYKHYFFCMGLGFSAKEKEVASNKMIAALMEREVEFKERDIAALDNGVLGKIVRKYAEQGCLPKKFNKDKVVIEKEIQRTVDWMETRAMFKI